MSLVGFGYDGVIPGASVDATLTASYVTLGLDAILPNERVLTGTPNQVIITDNGAGSTVVLSTPQDIATTSNPTFASLTLVQPAIVGGTPKVLSVTAGAHTTLDNSSAFVDVLLDLSRVVQFAGGAGATTTPSAHGLEIQYAEYHSAGAGVHTITEASTVYIAGPPTLTGPACVGTNIYALNVASGATNLGGALAVGDITASNVTLTTGGALRTNTTNAHTALLQAYNTAGSYTTFATLTAGAAPTMDIADGVTKAGAYIYRASGTDVAVADGGTGLSAFVVGDILICSTNTTTISGLADVAVNQVLTSGGIGVIPAWSGTPTLASMTLTAGLITYSGGAAITAGSMQSGRNGDGTATYQINVPTGGLFEYSINDVGKIFIDALGRLGILGLPSTGPAALEVTGDVLFGSTKVGGLNYVAVASGGIPATTVWYSSRGATNVFLLANTTTVATCTQGIGYQRISVSAAVHDSALEITNTPNGRGNLHAMKNGGEMTWGSVLNLAMYERAPEAGTAAITGVGTGSMTAGNHSYKVTFVTPEGESAAGTASNVVNVGANDTVTLSAVPLGSSRCTSRNIYRTDAGGAVWKLIGSIANNTVTTYNDSAADPGGAAAPTVNTTSNVWKSYVLDSATAISYVYDTSAALSTAGSKLASWKNNGVEKASLGYDGMLSLAGDLNMDSGTGLIRHNVTAGITASTTQTQVGGTALVAEVNEVSVVANANDTVTLPSAVAGYRVVIINNGANTLRIYPASGDNLGTGVDTLTTLASGSNVVYQAYDATNWESI